MDIERTLDDNGFERLNITSSKRSGKIFITKSNNGFSQYEISYERGKVPEAIGGKYTTPDYALKALKDFLEKHGDSLTVKRDKKYARRHATKLRKDN